MIINFERIKKASNAIHPRQKHHYEISFEYWTLARTESRTLAFIVWWLLKIWRFGNGCCLAIFLDKHYVETIRPKREF
jgi:hypothetical protein